MDHSEAAPILRMVFASVLCDPRIDVVIAAGERAQAAIVQGRVAEISRVKRQWQLGPQAFVLSFLRTAIFLVYAYEFRGWAVRFLEGLLHKLPKRIP